MSSTRDRESTARWTSRSPARRSRPSRPKSTRHEATRVIEIKGDNRYVTPGLIDIHTHVALWRSDGRRRHGLLRPRPDRRPRRRHDRARLRFGRCREHRRHALARHPESQDAHRHLRQRRQLRSHDADGGRRIEDGRRRRKVDRQRDRGQPRPDQGPQAAHGRPGRPGAERAADRPLQEDLRETTTCHSWCTSATAALPTTARPRRPRVTSSTASTPATSSRTWRRRTPAAS